ncbi:MAG: (Fe-S)-binding protein [Proteobacteria bacterium]|nr:(Fe-S)-binding protein [Pseudomonadota bacterium]
MKPWLVAIILTIAVAYFIHRVTYLIKLLKLGKPENRYDRIGERLLITIKQSILQFSQFKVAKGDYTYAGIMHIFIIAGFMILLPGEIEFIIGGLVPGFDFSFLGESAFGLFLLSQDLFIFAVLVGMIMALLRRFIMKPPQINYHLTAYLILGCISLLMLTLLTMNSLRLVDPKEIEFAAIATNWMPITSFVVKATGLNAMNHMLFEICWWLHLLVLMFFLDYIPNSKHLHVFSAIPANFFRNFPPPLVTLPNIDFEAEEIGSMGASKIEDFTWKQLFDGYTCTECGRCTDQCPANSTGKVLSPREIVLSLKENLFANADKLLSTPKDQWREMERIELIGGAITSDELWECTTCGACANVCPVGNEHLRDIIEMRRHLTMEEAAAPELMGKAMKNMETRSHPFLGTGFGPLDWQEGMDVPVFIPGETEYLLWIGCSVAYEERAQKIARAMVNILTAANVNFGILEEPRCTGDPAKQMGDELLFTETAQMNIMDFSEMEINKIITLCPHCYNSFTHHYPQLGGNYDVIPHAKYIFDLIASGKLNLSKTSETICYHDPCYLGRHNGIIDEPRKVISSIGELTEMPRNKKASFCCGGGGGNYWAEETGTRINQARAGEAEETKAQKIATACPFCLMMLTDGLKKFTDEPKIFDIAELVESHLITG